MTSLAQRTANRLNATHSTGPRTSPGKVAVASNPIRHGIFAAVPVVAGESSEEWDAFRQGVLVALATEGHLEVALGERVASILWRLRRLVQYEVNRTGAIQEKAAVVDDPDYNDPLTDDDRPAEERLVEKAREELTREKALDTQARAGRAVLDGFNGRPGAEPVSHDAARGILFRAWWMADNDFGASVEAFSSSPFLTALDQPGKKFQTVAWTVDLLRRALAYYVTASRVEIGHFMVSVCGMLDAEVAAGPAAVARAESNLSLCETRLANRTARRKAVRAILPADTLEKVSRYEAHLGRQLQQSLVQLERLQAGEIHGPAGGGDLFEKFHESGRAVDHFSEGSPGGPFDPTRGRDASYSLKWVGARVYYVICAHSHKHDKSDLRIGIIIC
jgi:hypothetical protein